MPQPTPESIENEVEVSGVARTSPLFEIRVREKKLRACQERRSVSKCAHCSHYEHCELVKEHMTDVKYRLPLLQKELGTEAEQQAKNNPWLGLV